MVRFACEARDFDATRWIEHRRARRMGRFAQLVVAAARQAEADAGLLVERESDRVGASVATAMGSLQAFEAAPR
jgi:3-oxoacyl-[acyl-carrier-protein] synthase II